MNRNQLSIAMATVLAVQPGGFTNVLNPDAKGKSVLALSTTADGAAELLIYGTIGDFFWSEGITALSIVEQLGQITASTINVRINSDGGVVTDGLAIYNALKRHGATINVYIDGIAASIASLIAMAGSTVRMPSNTMLMLHAPHAGAWGNAAALREAAAVLDTFATSMSESYTAKSQRAGDINSMLRDGKDHWFTAAEAVAFGLADEVISDEPIPVEATVAAAALLSYVAALSAGSVPVSATLRSHLQRTTTPTAFASLREGHQRAVYAHLEDNAMKQQCHTIMAAAAGAPNPAPAQPSPASTPPAAPGAPDAAAQPDSVLASLVDRNTRIREVFAQFQDIAGVRELEAACLADPRLSVEAAQSKLLAKIGHNAGPLNNPAAGPTVVAGLDQRDKTIIQVVSGVLARAGSLSGAEAEAARQDNPAARQPLYALAEASLIRAGVNTRNMTRDQIAAAVLAVQTTSDFPIILENSLNKMLLASYRLQPFTWNRFCATGTLSDYRPHSRYHMGSFNDLKEVNEAGEYENGVLSDAAKESIQGKRKGRILQITPEVIVNDDLGALTRPTQRLGQAAGRTIEKDVYALFPLNSGAGPTMSDGKALFHADHGNIAAVAALPTITSVDAARMQMALQMDVGSNDYLDIVPAVWLGPLSLGSTAREINAMEFNDEASKNQRRPNVVRGLFRDVVDTPRLPGSPWYVLADANIEPVFEVAFLDGVQTPTLEQEKNFRSDGLSWKVVHRYGVAAVGYRGVVKNAGQ